MKEQYKELFKRLKSWCKANNLFYDFSGDGPVFTIGDKKFFIVPPVDGKVISKLCGFNFSEADMEATQQVEFDYFAFEFGQRWYYCGKKVAKDEYNDEYYEVDFTDLKYIGKAQVQLEAPFTMLGVHSEYELLNGSHKADYWVKKAKFLGYKKIAICDKDTLAGTLAFQMACKKAEIDSVLGMTATVRTGENDYSLKLYATNEQGWQNILAINRYINVEFEGYVMEDTILLDNLGVGVIAVFTRDSQINDLNEEDALEHIAIYKEAFADLYYQVDPVSFYDDNDDLKHLQKINTYLKHYRKYLKPVLIGDAYYLDKEMYAIKETLNKVGHRATRYSEDEYFKTLDEHYAQLRPLFEDEDRFNSFFLKAAVNTVKIVEQCDYHINTGEHKIPKYNFVPEGKTKKEFFWELIENGFASKIAPYYKGKELDVYMERIEKEAKVIIGAKFIDYFLILWDIVSSAKRRGIVVGTGRGSVAGCLLAYLLDITEVDSVKFDLVFERFLNETRIARPQIIKVEIDDKVLIYNAFDEVITKRGKIYAKDLCEEDEIEIN